MRCRGRTEHGSCNCSAGFGIAFVQYKNPIKLLISGGVAC
jgi:hypothetical protein